MKTIVNCKPCEYIKHDGVRCGSPALRGRSFCFAHQRVQNHTRIPVDHSCHVLPNIRSQRDIRVAATTILRDLRDGRIDYLTARAMACTLRLANSALKQAARLDSLHRSLSGYRTTRIVSCPDLGL